MINKNNDQKKHFSLNQGKGIDGKLSQTILITIMVINVILVALPLLITIMMSLKTQQEFMKGFWVFPKTPQWGNYLKGLSGIGINMLNSLTCYIIVSICAVTISSIAAYVFSKHEFPGKEVLFSFIIALMIIPGVLTLTPSFLTVSLLHIKNTWWAILLPAISGQQIGNIFLFRTFMGQHPKELYEAAKVEGAGDFTMFFKICVPLSIPIIVIQLVGIFASMYNDYMWPYLVIENDSIQMLMPMLKKLANSLSATTGQPGVSYATFLLSGIPLIITTLIGLKFFINGDFAAGVKL